MKKTKHELGRLHLSKSKFYPKPLFGCGVLKSVNDFTEFFNEQTPDFFQPNHLMGI